MGRIRIALFLFLLLRAGASAQDAPTVEAQDSPTSDAQAVAVLNQALAVGGGAAAGTQSFSASGSITYYWAGKEVKGSVLVRSRGSDQFRMDAGLPDGTRSSVVNRGKGQVKELDGSVTKIGHFNALNQASLTLPLSRLSAAASDTTTIVSYVGVAEENGRPAHHLRIQRKAKTEAQAHGVPDDLRTMEVFVDASTFLVVKIRDTIHADRNVKEGHSREIHYSDYRSVNGVWVPFSVAEDFGGQRTWMLQLDSIQFNTGVSDADFSF